MATIQGQLNTPRDTTIQATNTALGLLGKDASLQDIKAALLQIVAALDPTADDYDDLSNKPQVNGVTLSGNKTSKQLGIRQTIPLTSAQYAQLSSAEKMDVDKDYIITDENATAAPIDDDSVSRNKVWSSYKVDEELDTLNSNIFIKGFSSVPVTIPTIGALSTNDVIIQVSCDNTFSAVIVESAAITNVYPIAASAISQTSIKIRFRNNDNTTYSNVNTTVNVLFI